MCTVWAGVPLLVVEPGDWVRVALLGGETMDDQLDLLMGRLRRRLISIAFAIDAGRIRADRKPASVSANEWSMWCDMVASGEKYGRRPFDKERQAEDDRLQALVDSVEDALDA